MRILTTILKSPRASLDALPLIRLVPDYYSQRILNHAARHLSYMITAADKVGSTTKEMFSNVHDCASQLVFLSML